MSTNRLVGDSFDAASQIVGQELETGATIQVAFDLSYGVGFGVSALDLGEVRGVCLSSYDRHWDLQCWCYLSLSVLTVKFAIGDHGDWRRRFGIFHCLIM